MTKTLPSPWGFECPLWRLPLVPRRWLGWDAPVGHRPRTGQEGHRHPETQAPPPEVLTLLRPTERTYRNVVDDKGHPAESHLVMGDYATHKHTEVRAWLEAKAQFKIRFTPTPPG